MSVANDPRSSRTAVGKPQVPVDTGGPAGNDPDEALVMTLVPRLRTQLWLHMVSTWSLRGRAEAVVEFCLKLFLYLTSYKDMLICKELNLTKENNMGFDLYSTGKHTSEKGEYFRNNVWHWRRLADFVVEQTGVIEEQDKEHWQFNNGHEVSGEVAKQIAQQLKHLIKDGTVSKAIKEVEEEEKKAERNNVQVQKLHEMLRDKVEKETGKKNLAPIDYPEADHDTWEWIQKRYDYGSSYPFTMENVEEFIKFCEDSNGFTIG